MPHTFKSYSTWEVALAVESQNPNPPPGGERVQEGDIVGVRKPHFGIGPGEVRRYLWLQVHGLDDNEMSVLNQSVMEGDIVHDKRRYCIPLDRLTGIDLGRVRDVNDAYQPFLPVDQDHVDDVEGRMDYLDVGLTPLDVHGLVFDKATRKFF